jgi:hypothetical protein
MFEPTHCGAVYVSEGGVAEDTDANVFEAEPLCLAAIKDPVDFSGLGDHDLDGIPDHEEACGSDEPTDPCDADTDGDGEGDLTDACPLDPDCQ